MESGDIHLKNHVATHAFLQTFLKKSAIFSMSDALIVPEHLLIKVVVARYRNEPFTHATLVCIMKDLHAAGLSPAYIAHHMEGIFSKWLSISTAI